VCVCLEDGEEMSKYKCISSWY